MKKGEIKEYEAASQHAWTTDGTMKNIFSREFRGGQRRINA
jgi:hypothetical protein